MSAALINRATFLAKTRAFFSKRGVMEVDVPLLSPTAPIDVHIDLVEASVLGKRAFLHSSPEYGMKKLLSQGSGDIYQLGHVFRDHERGSRHSIEFTMTEWYRIGFSLQELIEEVFAYVQLFLSIEQYECIAYSEVWKGHDEESFALEVEPMLGRGKATFVVDYPTQEAALARINERGFAERFELFVEGMELANGYNELTDSSEQRRRLEEANQKRQNLGKNCYPMDEEFIASLDQIPQCSGVAVGFDRLLMLRNQSEEIAQILPAALF